MMAYGDKSCCHCNGNENGTVIGSENCMTLPLYPLWRKHGISRNILIEDTVRDFLLLTNIYLFNS
jgi:hypothetical protein